MSKKRKANWYDRPENRREPLVILGKRWFEWLRERNYSEKTIVQKGDNLMLFFVWCFERGVREPAAVTRPLIERYQRHCFRLIGIHGKRLSFHGQHIRLQALKTFFSWAAKRNYMLHNPAADIELPRLPKALPKAVLTEQEAERVLALVDLEMPMGVRDRAILETLYSTGIRRGELLNLKLYDVDFERGTLFIRSGKGKKDRVVPVGERARMWLARYLDETRVSLAGRESGDCLFLSADGGALQAFRLSEVVRAAVDKADVGKRGSCHLFRHTMATLMLEGGADVRYVQHMLGHAELSTTEIYTRVSIKKLQEVHAMAHPAKLRKQSSLRESPKKKRNKPDTRDAG